MGYITRLIKIYHVLTYRFFLVSFFVVSSLSIIYLDIILKNVNNANQIFNSNAIFVNNIKNIKILNDNQNIISIYKEDNYINIINTEYGQIELVEITNNELNNIYNVSFDNSNNGQIICPQNFLPLQSKKNTKFNKKENLIHLKKDTKLKIEYINFNRNEIIEDILIIKNSYVNNKNYIDEYICFINHEGAENISMKKEFPQNNDYVITTKIQNTESVIDFLKSNNIDYKLAVNINKDKINNLYKRVIAVLAVCMFFTTSIIFSAKKTFDKLIKIVGFSVVLSIIIDLTIFILLKILTNIYPYLFAKMDIFIDLRHLTLLYLFIIAVSICSIFEAKYVKRKHIE